MADEAHQIFLSDPATKVKDPESVKINASQSSDCSTADLRILGKVSETSGIIRQRIQIYPISFVVTQVNTPSKHKACHPISSSPTSQTS